MALSIKDPKADRLARELARKTGESLTQAVTVALEERLRRVRARRPGRDLADELDEIATHCASLPVQDRRSPEEILGYDERGLPG
jgi:antitoxin VapB